MHFWCDKTWPNLASLLPRGLSALAGKTFNLQLLFSPLPDPYIAPESSRDESQLLTQASGLYSCLFTMQWGRGCVCWVRAETQTWHGPLGLETGDLGQACQMRTEFVKRYAIWWTSRGWDCNDVRPCCVKIKYPVAALAACRELIRAAEGACLGLRVTLSTSRESSIGLKRGENFLWFGSEISCLWLIIY